MNLQTTTEGGTSASGVANGGAVTTSLREFLAF